MSVIILIPEIEYNFIRCAEQFNSIFCIINMKHRLTPELLTYLKKEGYTMLIGIDRSTLKDYIYTPATWSINEYLNNIEDIDYDHPAVHMIDELLKLDWKHNFTYRVILPFDSYNYQSNLSKIRPSTSLGTLLRRNTTQRRYGKRTLFHSGDHRIRHRRAF